VAGAGEVKEVLSCVSEEVKEVKEGGIQEYSGRKLGIGYGVLPFPVF
jgi:formate hydrogenlyase subunit 4